MAWAVCIGTRKILGFFERLCFIYARMALIMTLAISVHGPHTTLEL